jgi:dynein heavy chain
VWRRGDAGFSLVAEAPRAFHRMVYFVKDGTHFVTRDNVHACVQFGVLHGAPHTSLRRVSAAGDQTSAGCGGRGADSCGGGGEDGDNGNAGPAAPRGPLATLLQLLGGVYMPQLSAADARWPESARREFLGTSHRFMAALTEAVHAEVGRTVLYVPRGSSSGNHSQAKRSPREAARDQALVQQLETAVIHWTRQVRGMLHRSQQPRGETDVGGGGRGGAKSSGVVPLGPLAEIAFWRRRAADLGGLSVQLASSGVVDVVAVLSAAGSGYLPEFIAQRGAIAREAAAARDNVLYLACLEEPCRALAAAAPAQVPGLLPRVLACVRLVWERSGQYNTPERLVGLLRRIAAEVVARCAAAVHACDPLTARGEAGVRRAAAVLRECMGACGALRYCYEAAAAGVAAVQQNSGGSGAGCGRGGWEGVNVAPVFLIVDALQQRCQDLTEVCEAHLQFVPMAADDAMGATAVAPGDSSAAVTAAAPAAPTGSQQAAVGEDAGAVAALAAAAAVAVGRGLVLPVFGGARGAEAEKSIRGIAATFLGLLAELRGLSYDILDVKALRWVLRDQGVGAVKVQARAGAPPPCRAPVAKRRAHACARAGGGVMPWSALVCLGVGCVYLAYCH